jgi:hypothetical protein
LQERYPKKHGVTPEKPPSSTPMIEEAILKGHRLAHENRLEGKDLGDSDELEGEKNEEFFKRLVFSGSSSFRRSLK